MNDNPARLTGAAIISPFARLRASIDRHDLAKAALCTFAFAVPMLLAGLPGVHTHYMYAALAAQNIAMFDVRGDYRMRLAVLGSASLLLAFTTALGAAAAPGGAGIALAATVTVTLVSAVLRHLSADYGPPVGITMMLTFLLALFIPDHSAHHALHTGLWTFGGGLLGLLTQVALWPFRPQHPVRRIVAECWLSAAELFAALQSEDNPAAAAPAQRHHRLAAHEAALREKLEKGRAALHAARTSRNAAFLGRLETLCTLAGMFARRAVAFHTALEHAIQNNPAFAELEPAFQPVLNSLANTSRTVALAVVSRQPAHLALAEVRVRRLGNLLQGFSDKAAAIADPHTDAELIGMAIPLFDRLKALIDTLRTTIDRAAERAAFSLELLDTDTWSLRPLASALNLSLKIDPHIVRYAVRITVLAALGIIVSKLWRLPHGYWLVFTMIVVLQPEFGATRQKAVQRAIGTLFGALIGSTLVWIPMSHGLKFALMAVFMFLFIACLRHNYAIAIFFVTPHVILLTEMSQVVTAGFAIERVLCTAGGGILAVVAAQIFWPLWERSRLPGLLRAALLANRDYWRNLFAHIESAQPLDDSATASYLRADAANAAVFASLKRMMGDPANKREGVGQMAAIANGNQRLTRALNVIALRVAQGEPLAGKSALAACAGPGARALQTLADAIAQTAENKNAPGRIAAMRAEIDALRLPANFGSANAGASASDVETHARTRQILGQLARCGTELNAMLLACETSLGEGVFETG